MIPAGSSWKMDETYIKVKGEWMYLCVAVLMLGFKNFESASRTLNGIEMVRMIKKEQVAFPMGTFYKKFCSLAA